MERLASWALRLIVVLNALAIVAAMGESYSGLYQWAHHHAIAGFWAGCWPLMIDTIILVGEAALFVSHHYQWKTSHKVWAWVVTFTALGVSVAANTGHVDSTDWLSRLTAALPPAALAFCMTVGLGVMKRYYANKPVKSHPADEITPGTLPTFPQLRERPAGERFHIGETPWIENGLPGFSRATEMRPVSRTETPESPDGERPAPAIPESLETTETFAGDFKVVPGKSFTLPRDERPGLNLPEKRVRDMLDVDPEISTNAVAKALGIAWATADKFLKASKEARGLAV